MGIAGIRNHHLTTQFDRLMSSSVIVGSSVSKSSKIFLNCGTIETMMNDRIPTATITTTIG